MLEEGELCAFLLGVELAVGCAENELAAGLRSL
jgi:hypothetical protein